MSRPASETNRIRVVRIIDRLNIGGPTKHVVWLSADLDASAFETVLVTGTVPPGEGDMSYFARAAGVDPVVIREMGRELGLRDIVVVAKLLKLLLRFKPTIVHTHKAKAGAAGRIAVSLYKWMTPSALWLTPRPCRVVHTFHGHIFHGYYGAVKSKLFIAIERMLAKITDCIITVSEQQRHEICETFRVGRSRQFRVIPLGIDLRDSSYQRGALRTEIQASDDDLLIGMIGRLTDVKNPQMLLEAAARLITASDPGRHRLRFVIIGDGPLRPELERSAERLGISDRVFFTGFREDVMPLYVDLDLVALTSLNEGTPLTLIEAMSAGRAVVATEVGGVVDILGARRGSVGRFSIWDHGATAPGQDPAALAEALEYLIERPDLRSDMGERGRAFVGERHRKDRLIRDIGQLYRDLASRDFVR